MDEMMSELLTRVKTALESTGRSLEEADGLWQRNKAKNPMSEMTRKMEASYQNLKFRTERLAIVADILSGRAYTVIEKDTQGDRELFIHRGGDARLVSLAEKMGLNREFVQARMEAEPTPEPKTNIFAPNLIGREYKKESYEEKTGG